MIKRLKNLKVAFLLFFAVITLLPNPSAFAYSPYFATDITPVPGGQAMQVVARNGSVYVSSYNACQVFKINGSYLETIAGVAYGYCSDSPDGSVAKTGHINEPSSIDVGPDGTVYIAEAYAHLVRAVLPDGTLKTVAGNGTTVDWSQRTDAADATQTPFDNPTFVKVGPDGNLYVYDSGVIRRIFPDGHTDHVVGDFSAFANNNPYVEGGVANQHYFSAEAFSNNVQGESWCKFDFDSQGNIYAYSGNSIYKINNNDDTIHTFYTEPSNPEQTLEDAPLSSSLIAGDGALAVDQNGNIWSWRVANSTNAIAYISPNDQIVRTVAGGGTVSNPPVVNSPPITGDQLRLPIVRNLTIDSNGNVYYLGKYTNSAGQNSIYVGRLSVNPDITPPEIQPVISPEPTSDGWSNTNNVSITWNVIDPESAITSTSGCDPVANISISGSTFTCTATSTGGTSTRSVTVKIDTDLPTISNLTWSQNPKPVTDSTTLTAPVNDNLSGVNRAEYYLGDTDPGTGNGTSMSVGSGNATATLGNTLATGVYKVNVRAEDNAGNWSTPVTDYLVVYDPSGYSMVGKQTVVPALTSGDVMPGLISNNQTDAAKFALSVKYSSQGTIAGSSGFGLSYSTGTNCRKSTAVNCHSFDLNATNIAWLTTLGTNNSTGIFQGNASLTVDGQTSNVLFRVTGVDGTRLSSTSPDQFQVRVFNTSQNPNTDTPIYNINLKNIARGNIKIS